ncbi:hypothetical protein EDD16DRAFT_496322 [Pisolithus croceorrhizus]|nr:hypothetical protein EDD16DRAFT_496322 [Pisolithus croceorrhizus]
MALYFQEYRIFWRVGGSLEPCSYSQRWLPPGQVFRTAPHSLRFIHPPFPLNTCPVSSGIQPIYPHPDHVVYPCAIVFSSPQTQSVLLTLLLSSSPYSLLINLFPFAVLLPLLKDASISARYPPFPIHRPILVLLCRFRVVSLNCTQGVGTLSQDLHAASSTSLYSDCSSRPLLTNHPRIPDDVPSFPSSDRAIAHIFAHSESSTRFIRDADGIWKQNLTFSWPETKSNSRWSVGETMQTEMATC